MAGRLDSRFSLAHTFILLCLGKQYLIVITPKMAYQIKSSEEGIKVACPPLLGPIKPEHARLNLSIKKVQVNPHA